MAEHTSKCLDGKKEGVIDATWEVQRRLPEKVFARRLKAKEEFSR